MYTLQKVISLSMLSSLQNGATDFQTLNTVSNLT